MLYELLSKVQRELHVRKTEYNSYGEFSYRGYDGVVEEVKRLLAKYGLVMYMTDEICVYNNATYVVATVTLFDPETKETLSAKGVAREMMNHKKMSDPQMTGTSSTYARKKALEGIFLFGTGDDPDGDASAQEDVQTFAPTKLSEKALVQLKKVCDDPLYGKMAMQKLKEMGVKQWSGCTQEHFDEVMELMQLL